YDLSQNNHCRTRIHFAECGHSSQAKVSALRHRARLAPLSVLCFSPLARGRTDEAGRAMMKSLHVFIRKQGNHFRVLYQRHYPNGLLEEVMLTQRFETADEAQSYAGLTRSAYLPRLDAASVAREPSTHRSVETVTPTRMIKRYSRATAYHEAGHAVVAWSLGLPIGAVSISDVDANGKSEIGWTGHLSLVEQVAVCSGGIAADAIFGHQTDKHAGAYDRMKIMQLIKDNGISEDERG